MEMAQIRKPECKLVGENGNIFNLTAIASNALRRDGQMQRAREMQQRIFSSHSYDEALSIISQYVEVI